MNALFRPSWLLHLGMSPLTLLLYRHVTYSIDHLWLTANWCVYRGFYPGTWLSVIRVIGLKSFLLTTLPGFRGEDDVHLSTSLLVLFDFLARITSQSYIVTSEFCSLCTCLGLVLLIPDSFDNQMRNLGFKWISNAGTSVNLKLSHLLPILAIYCGWVIETRLSHLFTSEKWVANPID